jgi:hypothetical protein
MSSLRTRRAIARISAGAIAVTGLIAGCTDDSFSDVSFGGSGTPTFSSSSSSSGDSDGAVRSNGICDNIKIGEACYAINSTGGGIDCEIGTSANSFCNQRYLCTSGRWELDPREPPGRTPSQCAYTCPSVFSDVAPAGICDGPTAIATICEYPDGVCGCAPVDGIHDPCLDVEPGDAGGEGGTTDASTDAGPTRKYEWRCVKTGPTEAGVKCPHLRPREGRECVVQFSPGCDYGSAVFEDGVQMGCDNNGWVTDLARSKQCEQ